MNSLRLFAVVLLQFYVFNLHCQEIKTRNNFTVVIDPGHGGKDPGAVSNGFYEKIIALNTSLKLGQILQDNGIKVIYTSNIKSCHRGIYSGIMVSINPTNRAKKMFSHFRMKFVHT